MRSAADRRHAHSKVSRTSRTSWRGRLVGALLASAPGLALAQAPDQVTVKDRLMCRTQAALREGLSAMEAKDKIWLDGLDDCHLSIDGIPAAIIQDNISRIKIRLFADGEQADMWTVPETVRPLRRQRAE
jgi:hypothetical protein